MSDHIVSVNPLVIEIERLRAELAAEQSKVQTLVDALTKIALTCIDGESTAIAHAALTKVCGGISEGRRGP